ADRRDTVMPKQLADEQAVAAAEHEQVKRPLEPGPRGEQGGMGEPLVVNRLVVGVELKVAAKVEPKPSRASLQDHRGVRGHLSHPSAFVPIKNNPMTVRCKNNLCVLQTERRLEALRLVPGPLKLLLHRAHPARPRGTPPASQRRPARPVSSGTP